MEARAKSYVTNRELFDSASIQDHVSHIWRRNLNCYLLPPPTGHNGTYFKFNCLRIRTNSHCVDSKLVNAELEYTKYPNMGHVSDIAQHVKAILRFDFTYDSHVLSMTTCSKLACNWKNASLRQQVEMSM